MRPVALLFVAALAACGGPGPEQTLPPRPMSATQHQQEAAQHDQLAADNVKLAEVAARSETRSSEPIHCIDRPLEGVTQTGGEPLEVLRPCWTSVTSPSARYRKWAEQHREHAAAHRRTAAVLRDTERLACAGLGEGEIASTPFSHAEDILRVEEVREGGRLRGVRIVFRRLPGLSAGWMHGSLHCHYARAAALGFPRDFLPTSPVTVPDVQVDVAETDDGIVVTIRSDRDEMAAAALGRARDLVANR